STSSPSTTTTTVASFDVAGAERSFANRINTLRDAEGLSPLAWDGSLASVGRSWSQQMIDGVDCSHNGSLASQVAGGWTKLAENLACNAPSVGSAHSALVGSSSHYLNMVDPDFTHIGVGVAIDAEGDIWATQVFVAR
ncbi:MAG TPA: CAP domain-containing protein, partial [Acidimicrobiia bacterium]